MGWIEAALAAYCSDVPAEKVRLVQALPEPESVPLANAPAVRLPLSPGRPDHPELVHPGEVARRRLGSLVGRQALLHAVAHIEFNAINLALDAALRFAGLPLAYYRDWLSVARDEARHFQMLAMRLDELGSAYGAFTAHNGLWEMAEKTAHDPMLRMALVPRVLEARGLDVTPGMIQRLLGVGDEASVNCLHVILEEEVRHVAIGSRWFDFLCRQRGLRPASTFIHLLNEYLPQRRGGPLNEDARREAGFSEEEMQAVMGRQ